MRKLIGGLILALCSALIVNSTAAEPTFSWRFAGARSLSESDKLLTWKTVTQLPEFTGFETNLIQRGAEKLGSALARGGGNQAELTQHFKPIVADLWAYPSIYELTKTDNGNTWVLAAKIPAANHEKWNVSWTAISVSTGAKAKLSRDGEWTVLGNAADTDIKSILEKAKAPFADTLHVNGDGQLLRKLLGDLNPSRAELRVTPRGNMLRAEGKILLSSDLPVRMEKWHVPTNSIREPLVGFTAIQGLAPHLAKTKLFPEGKAPNQIFIWNEAVNSFTTMFAMKVGDPKKFILDLAPTIQEKGKLPVGTWEMNTNVGSLTIKGLPVALPYIRPAHTNDTGFLMGGLFPLSEFAPTPIPAELAAEVTGRTNLLFYDWELTGDRLMHWRPLLQIGGMITRKSIPGFEVGPQLWLTKAAEKLGNTVSEISVKGPRELAFVRSSGLGFSALELLSIARWVAGPEGEIPLDATAPSLTPAAK